MAKLKRGYPTTRAEWQKWDDAHSLLRAQEVLDDPKRSKAAKKIASELAKEKAKESSQLMKIAQEALEAVESMVVESLKSMYESDDKTLPENFEERFTKMAKDVMKKKGWSKTKAVGLGIAIGKKKGKKK